MAGAFVAGAFVVGAFVVGAFVVGATVALGATFAVTAGPVVIAGDVATAPAVTTTDTVAFFLLPSTALTVILALPALTPVITPLAFTFAIFLALDLNVSFLRVAFLGFTDVLIFCLAPTLTVTFFGAVTFVTFFLIFLTTTLTTTFLLPDLTVILALPGFLAFTTPFLETEAIFFLLILYVTLAFLGFTVTFSFIEPYPAAAPL